MFDSCYPFRYKRFSNSSEGHYPCKRHVYTFNGRQGHCYLVQLEEYDFDLFALKFYLEFSDETEEHRYGQLTHLYEAAPVLRTCLNIMLQVYQERPLASFMFTGSPLPGQVEKKQTKRYRLYRKIMANFFSPVSFLHFINEDQSAYLLLNKEKHAREGALLQRVEQMLTALLSVG